MFNPNFKVLASTPRYQGTKVKVNTQRIQTPSGAVVEWDRMLMGDVAFAIPVTKDGMVLMSQEWRPGPERVLTQFTGARVVSDDKLADLKREIKEELGITGGKFTCLIKGLSCGPHISGFKSIYLVTDFEQSQNSPDEHELLNLIQIPLTSLVTELTSKYTTTGEMLLGAKLVMEYFKK